MTRKAVPTAAAGIQLFPFLAVLLCTMGSLLLLLVVISRHARDQAALHLRTASQVDEALTAEQTQLAARLEELRAARQRTLALLGEQRRDLSHVEEHSRRIRDEVERAERQAEDLARNDELDEQAKAKLRARLKSYAEETSALTKEVEQARRDARMRPNTFAIIPYDGPNGTRRRPIYIECSADGVVLQPEGIRLEETDFLVPVGSLTPLSAALRSAREYLVRADGQGKGDVGEPYPLFLVRPDGVFAYAVARSAMSGWESEFGYELIEQDWKVAYPPPDPGLTDAMGYAVLEARRRQAMIAQAAPRLVSPEDRLALRSGRTGTGPFGSGLLGQGGNSSGQQAGLAGAGRGVTGGNGRGNSRFGGADQADEVSGNAAVAPYQGLVIDTPQGAVLRHDAQVAHGGNHAGGSAVPGGPGGLGGGSVVGGGGGSARAAGLATGGGNGFGGATGSGAANGVAPNAALAGVGSTGAGGAGFGVGNGGGPGAPQPGGASAATGLTDMWGNPLTGGVAGAGPGGGSDAGSPQGSSLSGNGTGAATGASGGPGGSAASGSGLASSGSNGPALGSPGGGASGASGGQPGGSSGGGASLPIQSPGGPVNAQLNLSDPNAAGNGNPNTGSTATPNTTTTANGGRGGRSGSGSGTGSGQAFSDASANAPTTPNAPTRPQGAFDTTGQRYGQAKTSTSNNDPAHAGAHGASASSDDAPVQLTAEQREKLERAAARRARNWGIPDANQNAVAIAKPINLEIRSDRLVIIENPRRPERSRTIPLSGPTTTALDPLVTAIWEQVNGWGIAGNGLYWRPVLVVQVAPDAQQRYAELQTLLEGSGLEMKQKPSVASPGLPTYR